MDNKQIEETSIWSLYEKGRNYLRLIKAYTDTDRNHRMYNGNQWEGAKLGDVEPVQKNFIKPIVKYKVGVIHDNLYAIHYSSQNYESREFAKEAEKYCNMLNRYASRIWEKDEMDFLGRRLTKEAAINDEGILYVDFDTEKMWPVNELLRKNDVYYGNENSDDIQSQPYILIKKRMPVSNAMELARGKGVSEDLIRLIVGDNDNFEESGDAAKEEIENMTTVVYKMYKSNGTVHFSAATRYVELIKDTDTGLTLYPIAHFVWEEKVGSARGEGEVRYLIPNQIEVNRTEMRRVLTVKSQAYPQKIADKSKITNPSALNTVGGIIDVQGSTVDDVRKIVGTLTPAQMSPDVKQLQDDLIQVTRDLAGAGDIATGTVNPENASGRAILAVQQASQSPMTEQKESYKKFIEDVARIWLEYLIVHSAEGVNMEDVTTDPMSGEEVVQIITVPQITLRQLQATVKVDVTPKSVYDKFAQEQTLENLLTGGWFNPQKIGELETYAKLLDDDAVAPKVKILEGIDYIKQEQRRIAQINAQAQMMQQRANQFISSDIDAQAAQIADARNMLAAQQMQQMMPTAAE